MTMMLTDDSQMLIEAVRDFARGELIERDREWDRHERSCCMEIAPLYDMGLLALRIPEEFGGVSCPMLPYAHIIRELAACSASVAVTVAVHNMVCEIINVYASPELKREILPQLAQPGNLAAFAISEPDSGSDPGSAKTRADSEAGGYRVTGSKMWVTNGISGRWFVVLAGTGESGTHRDLSMLLLDAESEGVTRNPIHGKMGIRGSETAEMALDGVFIPEERLLAEPGAGMRISLSALDGGRIGIAAQAIGIAEACLREMTSYVQQREQFGQPIARFQAIQWMLADSATEVMAARRLMERAAWLKDQDRPFTQEASMAKLFASEMCGRVADRAVQAHGGYGFVHECRVEQLYRDARITRIYEGTSEVQRIVISRGLLRL